ncbi:MAG TPA: ABC transporter substrate-binding protein [Solirubrobacterales bacterium]|jgi:putative hydroxymethylpyrimidine transport system substrate-binding protein|nr:ABC transporter substrate-binding protein [Solirubrobacterales bacterium]
MKRLLPRVTAVALALVILAAGLAACGSKSENTTGEAEKLTLDLDFYPNADHAGIYMAQEEGLFKEAGLGVTIDSPTDPSAPLKDVASGRADLAITYEPEVVLAREEGLDVVAVGALVNQPLTSLMWLKKSGIKGVADLKGKTVSFAGIPYQEAFLKTILRRAKVPASTVKPVNVNFGLVQSLVDNSAQAMLGGYSNVEGVDLRERGLAPTITPVDQLGVPTYDELVVVARRSTLEEQGERIRLFISALRRGTEAAVANPKAATEAILGANSSLEPKLTEAQVKATLPLLAARTAGKPYGYMDPKEWEAFAAWMRDEELISELPQASELLSNAYLVDEIPE